MVDVPAILHRAQVKLVQVFKHLGQVKELGDELFHVRRGTVDATPCIADGKKQAVGMVKAATLQIDMQRRKRLHAQQVVQDDAARRVVRAIQESLHNAC